MWTAFAGWHLIALLIVPVWFALTIWALVVTIRSPRAELAEKIILCIILVFFPVLGLVAWALAWFTKKRSTPRSS